MTVSFSHNLGPVLGAQSAQQFERARAITPGGSMRAAPFFPPHPPYAMRGAGYRLTDIDGREFCDLANNFFSLVHGHAFAPICSALRDAIDNGTAFGLPTESETALAEQIRQRSPRLENVRFTSSGTEAVMFMIKAARALTGRHAIAKIEGAYHGAYDYAEVGLDSSPSNWGEAEPASVLYARGTPPAIATDVVVLPFNDAQTCREILTRHKNRLAAVLLDPVPSRVGMVAASPDFYAALQDCCRKYGILLIVDEVISFRLAYRGAFDEFGLEPDFVALGKIIGGGMPVGAVAGPAANMTVFDHTRGKPPVSHGGTFSANPLGMIAGSIGLNAFDRSAVERLNAMGERLRSQLSDRIRRHKVDAQVTGFGSLFRVHLKRSAIEDYRTAYPTIQQKAALTKVHMATLERGFLLTPNCSGALSTPMTDDVVQGAVESIIEAMQEVQKSEPWS